MLHAAFVRVSFAHARVRGWMLGQRLPAGVHAVFTAADMPAACRPRACHAVPNPYAKIRARIRAGARRGLLCGRAIALKWRSRAILPKERGAGGVDYSPCSASDCRDA